MQYKAASDNELIAYYLKGDERSLQELIIRHKGRVFSSILLLVKERDIANDLFQDTFIKVINTLRAGKYKEEGRFLSWVVRIAHNLVVDYFRHQACAPLMLRDTEDFRITDKIMNEEPAEVKSSGCSQIKKVRLLIEQLPADQREVVIMRIYGNLSFIEISEAMNCTVNTCLARMHYAVCRMRLIIKEKKLDLSR